MSRLGSGIGRVAVVLLVVALAACAAIYQSHGYVPRDEELAKLTVGTSTREDVARAVGRPSSTGLLTGAAWYYVGSRFKTVGPKESKEVDRQVVAVSFTEAGLVENIERFGLEKGRAVVLSRRVTDSNIKGLGFLRQLLGNIGNLNAAQILNNN